MTENNEQKNLGDYEIKEEPIKTLADEISADPLFQMISEDPLAAKILLLLVRERRALWINRIAEFLNADYDAAHKKVKLMLNQGLLRRLEPNDFNPSELLVRSIQDAHAHGFRDFNDFRRATWVTLNTPDVGGKKSSDWWITFLGLLEAKYKFIGA